MGLLTTSSVSPHDVSVSWATLSGHFDAFVLRVSDPKQQFDTQEFRLPRGARNFTVPNLLDATAYDLELYGISHDLHTPSVFAHAVTGTPYFSSNHIKSQFCIQYYTPPITFDPLSLKWHGYHRSK